MAATKDVLLPDIGDFDNVDVIEVLVSPGDVVRQDDSLITLESEKATMEVPSPDAGKVVEVKVRVGDKISQGDLIATLELTEEAADQARETAPPEQPAAPKVAAKEPEAAQPELAPEIVAGAPREPSEERRAPAGEAAPRAVTVHASPSVRRLARELGADLARISGSGPKGRILQDDVRAYVKQVLTEGAPLGAGMPAPGPEIDFSRYGEIEHKPLTRIQKISARNLLRNWQSIPHVVQFGEADITELDAFRRQQAEPLREQGIKLTLLAFFLQAVAVALRQFPSFNASLHPDGEQLILKQYVHIGVAVDTPHGLVVPVIRDVDRKGLLALANELSTLSEKARAGKLTPGDMQGGCFSISSLGGIGGTAFTPIINAPEVAILGISRASLRPVYAAQDPEPRLILPLSLAYDHRVIDGAEGARFIEFLAGLLGDVRRMLL